MWVSIALSLGLAVLCAYVWTYRELHLRMLWVARLNVFRTIGRFSFNSEIDLMARDLLMKRPESGTLIGCGFAAVGGGILGCFLSLFFLLNEIETIKRIIKVVCPALAVGEFALGWVVSWLMHQLFIARNSGKL